MLPPLLGLAPFSGHSDPSTLNPLLRMLDRAGVSMETSLEPRRGGCTQPDRYDGSESGIWQQDGSARSSVQEWDRWVRPRLGPRFVLQDSESGGPRPRAEPQFPAHMVDHDQPDLGGGAECAPVMQPLLPPPVLQHRHMWVAPVQCSCRAV